MAKPRGIEENDDGFKQDIFEKIPNKIKLSSQIKKQIAQNFSLHGRK